MFCLKISLKELHTSPPKIIFWEEIKRAMYEPDEKMSMTTSIPWNTAAQE